METEFKDICVKVYWTETDEKQILLDIDTIRADFEKQLKELEGEVEFSNQD